MTNTVTGASPDIPKGRAGRTQAVLQRVGTESRHSLAFSSCVIWANGSLWNLKFSNCETGVITLLTCYSC